MTPDLSATVEPARSLVRKTTEAVNPPVLAVVRCSPVDLRTTLGYDGRSGLRTRPCGRLRSAPAQAGSWHDKPILDVLHDPKLARANRDYLHGFYGVVKGSAGHVRFVLVTGVSRFSGLNNLKDISPDPRYATLCGYREEDLDRVFGAGLDRETIRATGVCQPPPVLRSRPKA